MAVSVIGAGTMGNGIAHVFAQHAFEVNIVDVSESQLQKAIDMITKTLDRQIAKEIIRKEKKEETLANIKTTSSLNEAVKNSDLVIEAATENVDIKQKIFKELDSVAPANCMLATNTSSISITRIAAATNRPGMVIGMHFMNPVPVMKLVELAKK
jgi:3-hydroxybutyryl-CoA dehydrogenase